LSFPSAARQAREYVTSHGRSARDVTTRDLVTVTEEASLEQIATLLEKHRIKRVPVVRDGKLVGIVSRANRVRRRGHLRWRRPPVGSDALDSRA
jgi:CBS domain-containing protein